MPSVNWPACRGTVMVQHCHKKAVLHYPDGQEVVSGWTGQCQAGGVSKHSIWYRTYVHRLKTRQSVNTQDVCIRFKKRFGLYHVSVKGERGHPMFTISCLSSVSICSDNFHICMLKKSFFFGCMMPLRMQTMNFEFFMATRPNPSKAKPSLHLYLWWWKAQWG